MARAPGAPEDPGTSPRALRGPSRGVRGLLRGIRSLAGLNMYNLRNQCKTHPPGPGNRLLGESKSHARPKSHRKMRRASPPHFPVALGAGRARLKPQNRRFPPPEINSAPGLGNRLPVESNVPFPPQETLENVGGGSPSHFPVASEAGRPRLESQNRRFPNPLKCSITGL